MLHRADREARVFEIEIFAADAEAAAIAAGAAGILDQLEAQDAGRKLAFDDLDRRDHRIALVDRDAGRAVLGGAGAGAAGDDLVLHIGLAGLGRAPAEDDGAAAGAVGPHLVGHDVGERVIDRIDQRMHGRIIGVHRRREARVEHATVAHRDGEGVQQALAHIDEPDR